MHTKKSTHNWCDCDFYVEKRNRTTRVCFSSCAMGNQFRGRFFEIVFITKLDHKVRSFTEKSDHYKNKFKEADLVMLFAWAVISRS